MRDDETETIRGQEAKLFRREPFLIYLLPDGRFAAKQDGEWLIKSTVKTLEATINKARPVFKVFRISGGRWDEPETVEVIEAVGFKGQGSARRLIKPDGTTERGDRDLFDYDAKLVAELTEHFKAAHKIKASLEKQEARLMKRAVRRKE